MKISRATIVGAYQMETLRCLNITMGRIKTLTETHTGGKDAGLAEAARIAGAFRAHLVTMEDAFERACNEMVDPEFAPFTLLGAE